MTDNIQRVGNYPDNSQLRRRWLRIAYAIVANFVTMVMVLLDFIFTAWLWFYWIDLTYANRIPLISFWFNFIEFSKMAKFCSKTKYPSRYTL